MADKYIYIYYHYYKRLKLYSGNSRKMVDKQKTDNYIVVIRDIHFDWNSSKNVSNQAKHGVTFEEAATVFSDALYIEIKDPDHSQDEERFIALGISSRCRLLVVIHSVMRDDETVRIISARPATATEERQYGGKTNARRI